MSEISKEVESLINRLKSISDGSSERAQRSINNLIDRVEWFNESGDSEKLSECVAEASLWGVV
jgi:hypothetical protein